MRNAARSVCWTAHVFGAASANTKNTMTLSTRLSATIQSPAPPKRMPNRYDVMSCAASASSVTEFTVRSGRSSMCASRPARFSPCSSSASAFTRLMRRKAVSATASTIEQRKRTTIAMTA